MNLARDRVRDDAALVGDVASTVSKELGLNATNRTLGRSIVIAALDSYIAAVSSSTSAAATSGGESVRDSLSSTLEVTIGRAGSHTRDDGALLQQGEAAFRKSAKGYGSLGNQVLSEVYQKVTTRLTGALVQLQMMQYEAEQERKGENRGTNCSNRDVESGFTGFGRVERLSASGSGNVLKGGLIRRHMFQVPCAYLR